MDKIIMWIMAMGVILGGADRLLRNRFGFGERFEEGFMLLGPTALSMAGLICLTPLLSLGLEKTIVPVFTWLGLDPGLLGGVLAIDMGGYQLASTLSDMPQFARYAGIIVAATLGCTITFTIPVGMGMLKKGERGTFARGILLGLGAMPVTLLLGGMMCGVPVGYLLIQSLPVFLLSILLMIGIWKFPDQMIHGFSVFAEVIKIAATLGLILGAFSYMTGVSLLPGLTPVEEAMEVVASIGIVMLGSLPVAELLQRILRRPLGWIGEKTDMNKQSVAGFLISIVSPLSTIALFQKMDERGKVANAAFLVCGTSALAAHLGFTMSVAAEAAPAMLVSKLAGGICGVVITLIFTREKKAG